jgi:MFS family permease
VALVAFVMVEPLQRRKRHRFDWAGVVTLLGWTGTLVFAIESGGREYPWGSPEIVGALTAAVVLFVAFIAIQRRAVEPLIPFNVFRVPAFRASALVTLFLGMSMFGVMSFMPLYGRTVLGLSATGSGRILIPLLLAMMLASPIGARFVLKIGFRAVVMTGSTLVTVGILMLTRLTVESSQLELSLYLVCLGAGMGLVFMSTSLAAQNSVSMPQMGVATGLVNFTRQLGGAIGVAIAGSVMLTTLTNRLEEAFGSGVNASELLTPTDSSTPLSGSAKASVAEAFSDALHRTFWVAVVVVVLGLLCTLLMPRGSATDIRDKARENDLPIDRLAADGETFAITGKT